MSETEKGSPGQAAETFMEQLENRGFFKQIEELEASLKIISSELNTIGKAAVDRMNETESTFAHVLAIEAILVEMLKANPVDAEAIKTVIKNRTAGISGVPEGSPMVVEAAEDILKQLEDDTGTGAGIEAKNDDDVDGTV